MKQHIRQLSLAATAFLLSACVAVNTQLGRDIADRGEAIATNVRDCQLLLNRPTVAPSDPLETHSIGLLNWNIRKGTRDSWQKDLRDLAVGKELVLLQEAVLNFGIEHQLEELRYSSFSQGFTTGSRTTGVVTYSVRKPLSECHLTVVEPLLRSRKATSITEFSIAGSEKTLVVVNVHAVNISLGLIRFRDQMEQIRHVLAVHDGPAILSGDFNTWRQKRMDIVNEITSELELSAVLIDEDHRKTFNGHALDHVFVRGLSIDSSETKRVTSSDHNPISVELRL
ncbi:MAG: endonuclease/exonuclease/phosphatase family protein [Pseudomonadales bacterium]|nr:endonuclease/exonuclease/phosphatase family protein [Pseudomonadales bacterium]